MNRTQFEKLRESNPFMTLNDIVYELILQEIMSISIKPGTKIFESIIAQDIGVSRSPVKYALEKLSRGGYVKIQNSRYYVADFSYEEYLELQDLSLALETLGARTAAIKASDEEINELFRKADETNKLYEKARIAGSDFSYKLILNAELDFHFSILKASHNRHLIEVYDSLRHRLLFYRSYILYTRPEGFYEAYDTDHSYICTALRYRDPEMAAAAINHHIEVSKKGLERFGLTKRMRQY